MSEVLGADGTATWSGPAIGLLDLDAFFASVEQLDHPEWRGRPVIVGGSAERRGVVSTASYEARPYGVHSAMPSYQAMRLCPDAIWTQGRFARYRELSSKVMSLIERETPRVEQVSIDEAFFDVTPGRYSREDPVLICRRIQERIGELGISCSIGLGQNKTVAKIASERDKPHGLCVVMPGQAAEFLAPLPVKALSGIGPATEARLREMGIRTLGQLAQAKVERMRHVFGVHGPRMVQRAAGRETSRVMSIAHRGTPKSVSNERTFSHDLTSRKDVEAAVAHVSALVGMRLRAKGLKGSEVTLRLKFDYEHTRTIQRPLGHETDDERDFGRVAKELLGDLWSEGTPVRLVGVMVSGFGSGRSSTQLTLFDTGDGEPSQRPLSRGRDSSRDRDARRRLSEATDNIRSRFGAGALTLGYDLRLRDTLSDTISNNHDGMSEMPGPKDKSGAGQDT